MNETEAFLKNMWRNHKPMLILGVLALIGGFYLLARFGHFQEPAPMTHTDTHLMPSTSGVYGSLASTTGPAGQTIYADTPDSGAGGGLIPFQTMEQQWNDYIAPGWSKDGHLYG